MGYTSNQTDDDDQNHTDNEEDSGSDFNNNGPVDSESATRPTFPVTEGIPNSANVSITHVNIGQTQEISPFSIVE